MNERRCLKFTCYIYMPDDNASWKQLRSHASKTMGRVQLFDEKNNKVNGNMKAFTNLGQLLNIVMTQYRKRVITRVPAHKK